MAKKDYKNWNKDDFIKEIEQLRKRKKYGLVWEDKPEDVVERCKKELPVLEEVEKRNISKDPDGPVNLLIEGDNYHSLSVLNYTHKGKIDVIYIDPPYNTGAKDWKYNNHYVDDNDTYRHSKWLSMMYNRLSIVKNLLTESGALICAIDHNEQETLGLLLADMFPEKEKVCVTIIHNPGGIQGKNFSYTHENAYFVFPKNGTYISKVKRDDVKPTPLRDWGGEESKRNSAKNCFYPIIVDQELNIITFGDILPENEHPSSSIVKTSDGKLLIYPIDSEGIERKWRFARHTVDMIKDELRCERVNNEPTIRRYKQRYRWKTVWTDSKYNANVHGSQFLSKIINERFPYPKSLYTVQDCIKAITHNKDNSVILDFFAGSGTTGHAVMELNKEDGGNRQFILCTNNENKIAEEVTYPRIKGVIDGYADVEGIPANLKYFKTAFVKKSEVSDDTRRDLVKKSTDMICVKEGTYDKVYDNKDFKIYKDKKYITGILFNLDKIDDFKKKIEKVGMESHLYVFSLSNDSFEADFDDLLVLHELIPIPESILEVYRKLCK